MTTNDPQPTRGENRITIAVKQEQISAAPGNGVNLLVGILNDGPQDEQVEITVRGVPAGWITPINDSRLVHVPAGQAETVSLIILPPPLPESRVRPVSAGDPGGQP